MYKIRLTLFLWLGILCMPPLYSQNVLGVIKNLIIAEKKRDEDKTEEELGVAIKQVETSLTFIQNLQAKKQRQKTEDNNTNSDVYTMIQKRESGLLSRIQRLKALREERQKTNVLVVAETINDMQNSDKN